MKLNKMAVAIAFSWLVAAPPLGAYDLFHVGNSVYSPYDVVFCTTIIPPRSYDDHGHLGIISAQCVGRTDFDGAVAAVSQQTLGPRLNKLDSELAQAEKNNQILSATVDALKSDLEAIREHKGKNVVGN